MGKAKRAKLVTVETIRCNRSGREYEATRLRYDFTACSPGQVVSPKGHIALCPVCGKPGERRACKASERRPLGERFVHRAESTFTASGPMPLRIVSECP